MNKSLMQIGQQLSAIWKELGFNQRVSIVVAGMAVIGGLAGIFSWSNRVEYTMLFGNLAEAEAGKVVAALDEAKVDYRVRNGSIMVPADQVHRLRMQLATKGVPGGGQTGFSLFDKPNFGISDFVQRVNYLRAIQGELSTTISKVDGIDSAQVALFMPEKAGWELKASFQSPSHIAITIGARENDDPDGHA
jgi:flagellar M-ring protein FliF